MQPISRRSLVKSSLTAIAVSPVLPFLPSAFASTLPTLSASTVAAAKSALISLNHKIGSRTATATDVQSPATALSILFGNMQETGWNTAVTPLLKSDIQSQINKGNPDQSARIRSLLASNGVGITSAQAEHYFHLTVSELDQILSKLSSPGLYAMEKNFATDLEKGAKHIEAEGVQHVSERGTSQAHLRKVILDLSPCGFDGFVMGGLGLFSPFPIDILFGLGSLVYGFFAAESWC